VTSSVSTPPGRPLLIFDGDCGFCRRWIGRWKALTGEAVDYAESQQVAYRFPEIAQEAFARSVQLVLPDGEVFEGAEAVFRSLAFAPRRSWLLSAYRHVPGFAPVSELAYRVIARHRAAASAVTSALWGKTVALSTFAFSTSLFLRLIGVCYFAAFASLWVQIDGLVGSRGILPLGRYMEAARSQLQGVRWDLLPTLTWISGSDGFLHFLCGAGSVASLLVIFGILPSLALAICWVFYLSLCVAGQEFLQFQWDTLLLETGFLSIFLAPIGRWRIGRAVEGPKSIRILLLWLLFRLTFSSGFVKLATHDPTWRNLTALTYHYWTQPIPPWTAWFMSHGSIAFLKLSCLTMFVIELGAPFLIPAPRRVRLFAAACMAGLQVIIAATGNYAFFNLLTIALCVLLIDDESLPRAWRERVAVSAPARGKWPRLLIAPFAVVLGLLSCVEFFTLTLQWRIPWPGFAISLARAAIPFRSVNHYGLFSVMTTTRPEIVLEGSQDGVRWQEYEFKWKAGDLNRRPGFVAPHQPRLDWQMWFAALGSDSENPWFLEFCARLLEGRSEVTDLLARNPFPRDPPRYLRAVVYEYRFTSSAERRASGAWWHRDLKGLYLPVLSRDMLQTEQ
jgi:predicted DCC family thiol-disulfide oxidoreductase YuxK